MTVRRNGRAAATIVDLRESAEMCQALAAELLELATELEIHADGLEVELGLGTPDEIDMKVFASNHAVEARILAVLDDYPAGIRIEELADECRRRGWASDDFSAETLAAALGCAPTDIVRRSS